MTISKRMSCLLESVQEAVEVYRVLFWSKFVNWWSRVAINVGLKMSYFLMRI
jgi:hypothetical protein